MLPWMNKITPSKRRRDGPRFIKFIREFELLKHKHHSHTLTSQLLSYKKLTTIHLTPVQSMPWPIPSPIKQPSIPLFFLIHTQTPHSHATSSLNELLLSSLLRPSPRLSCPFLCSFLLPSPGGGGSGLAALASSNGLELCVLESSNGF